MAYPTGVPTRDVSVGAAWILENAEALKLQITVDASRSLIWEATGDRFESIPQTITAPAAGASLVLELLTTDSPGYRDADTHAIIDVSAPDSHTHTYTITLRLLDASNVLVPGSTPYIIGPFVVPAGGSEIDLDLLLAASSTEGILLPDVGTALAAMQAQIDALGTGGGGSGPADWNTLLNKPVVIGAGATAAAARAVIGAGTSDLVLGTSGTTAAAGNDSRLSDDRAPANSSVTNAKVSPTAAISADKLADGTANKIMTAAERTKLAALDTDANLKNRANHTGTEPVSALPLAFNANIYQTSGGSWPSAAAYEATRMIMWWGYPGLSSPPATTGRPAAVSGQDIYMQKVS